MESLRSAIVGPNPNFMPSRRFAIKTPAVNSTDMPMASRARPGSAGALAAKYAGHGADFRIEQGRHHVAQIIRTDFNVAVAGDQNVVRGDFGQAMETIVWCVRPWRLPGDQDPAGNVRVASANFADHGQGEIIWLVGREQDFDNRRSSGGKSSRYFLSSAPHCRVRALIRRRAGAWLGKFARFSVR